MEILYFCIGLVGLILGAEFLVRGSAKLAVFLGVSPLVVGLTIVALGTSAPELAVSVNSSLLGKPDVALGNVIGSNIINILFVLGVSALISPLKVDQQLVRTEVPIMIASSLLVYLMSANGVISQTEGIILFTLIIVYIAYTFIKGRKESEKVTKEYEEEFGLKNTPTRWAPLYNILLIVVGSVLLVKGSDFFLDGALFIARYFEISEFIISILVIALGTSLPEIVTSIIAGLKHENDIAVGNVIGSNIFNTLAVLGAASAVSSEGMAINQEALSLDIPVMIAVAVACLPIFIANYTITRLRGGIFFGYFIAYVVFLLLSAKSNSFLPYYKQIMAFFVIPLTLITLSTFLYRGFRHTSKPED